MNARATRPWDKSTSRILVTGDVIHREGIFPALNQIKSPSVTQGLIFPDLSNQSSPPVISATMLFRDVPPHSSPTAPSIIHDTLPDPEVVDAPDIAEVFESPPVAEPEPPIIHAPEPPPPVRRSSQSTTVPDHYGFNATSGADPDHPTFSQAMAGPDRKAWESAMRDEFDSLVEHSVGTLVDPPPNANIIGGCGYLTRSEMNITVL